MNQFHVNPEKLKYKSNENNKMKATNVMDIIMPMNGIHAIIYCHNFYAGNANVTISHIKGKYKRKQRHQQKCSQKILCVGIALINLQ